MKIIGTYIATALLLLGAIGMAGAQGPQGGRGGPGGPGRMGGGGRSFDPAAREWKVLDQLNLNASQKKKAKSLTDGYSARVKAEFSKMAPPAGRGRPDFQAMRAKMKPIRDQYEKSLSKVLTKDQMAKYGKIREEMRSQRRGPGGPGGPGGAGGRGGH